MEQKLPEAVFKNVRVLSLGVLNTNIVLRATGIKSRKIV